MKLESKIEGLLFYKGEDVSISKLAELLEVQEQEINDALVQLEESLKDRGLVLVRKDNSVVLGITGELGSLIESIRKDEITKELSKASLETLSIILYKNGASSDASSAGVTRSEIDYIRGVNSSFILRNLLVRGLIEKVIDVKDTRRILYRPTLNTLMYLGIKSVEDLPNYKETVSQLEEVIKESKTNE